MALLLATFVDTRSPGLDDLAHATLRARPVVVPGCRRGLQFVARSKAESVHAPLPLPAGSDWRLTSHVHGDGVFQPTLPKTPAVDCSTETCAEASDPVGPLWLGGDAHLDGGCVWAVAVNGPPDRITVIWPSGTYARFGRVIRVYASDGRLLADSTRPFAGSGWAPTDDQLPPRCLVNDRDVVALDRAGPVKTP